MSDLTQTVVPSSLYGIARGTFGWGVHLVRDGRIVGRAHFSDRKLGGSQTALAAAHAYRDELMQLHPPTPRAVSNQRLLSTNTSGYPGVHPFRKKGKVVAYIARSQLPDRRILLRYFGFHTYTKEGALALAIEERQRQLAQVHGVQLRDEFAKSTVTAPPQLSPEDLCPRRKHEGSKAIKKPRLDRAREAEVAAKILEQHGHTGRWSRGTAAVRWISRFRDPLGTAGWEVHIAKNRCPLARRVFMDSRHGGAAAGFKTAQQFRDAQVTALGLALT